MKSHSYKENHLININFFAFQKVEEGQPSTDEQSSDEEGGEETGRSDKIDSREKGRSTKNE